MKGSSTYGHVHYLLRKTEVRRKIIGNRAAAAQITSIDKQFTIIIP